LFETGEDFLTGNRLDATRVDVVNPALDLLFPLLTEIEAVQASGNRFDQIRALARWQLKGGFKDSVRLGHRKGILAGWQVPARFANTLKRKPAQRTAVQLRPHQQTRGLR
jgi:hypothetical protein